MKEFKKPLKLYVGEVLEDSAQSRDNDHILVFMVLERLGYGYFADGKFIIYLSSIDKMPSFESITRCRRHFQNDNGEYLGSEKVEEIRKKYQEKYREEAASGRMNVGGFYSR